MSHKIKTNLLVDGTITLTNIPSNDVILRNGTQVNNVTLENLT